jgi:signal transduction histidine kinase
LNDPEEMDAIMKRLRDMEIEVIEASDVDRLKDGKKDTDDDEEDKTADQRADILDDPVRMYLKQMGQVPLLTREQEVEISKRIEDAELNVLKHINKYGFVVNMYLDLAEKLLDGKERFDLNLEVFDVREAASAVIRLVRGQVERAGLEFVAPDLRERIEVRADRRALKQMSLNLISNAIKATPPGGRVAFGLAREGEDLVLVVEDTGCGVAEADLARLGRPFEQAGSPDQKAAGAGLGRSLVKALCDLHGGEMTLSSREGQGTRVSLRLPIVVRDQVQPELDLT